MLNNKIQVNKIGSLLITIAANLIFCRASFAETLSPDRLSDWQQYFDRDVLWLIILANAVLASFMILANIWYVRLSRTLRARHLVDKASLIKLEQMANYDQLTGLPNRRLLFDLLDRSISHARRNYRKVCVCVFDLDDFKQINDQYGHPAGDAVLVEVARRLNEWIRLSDSAGRLGGDEFCFMSEDISSSEDAQVMKSRLRAAFSKPFFVKDQAYPLSFSCGVAFYPEDGKNTADLISMADERMYKDKSKEQKKEYNFSYN